MDVARAWSLVDRGGENGGGVEAAEKHPEGVKRNRGPNPQAHFIPSTDCMAKHTTMSCFGGLGTHDNIFLGGCGETSFRFGPPCV